MQITIELLNQTAIIKVKTCSINIAQMWSTPYLMESNERDFPSQTREAGSL